jgi:hypothetical protein
MRCAVDLTAIYQTAATLAKRSKKMAYGFKISMTSDINFVLFLAATNFHG